MMFAFCFHNKKIMTVPSSVYYFVVVLALCQGCLSMKNTDKVLCIEKERVALLKFKHDLINGVNRLTSWAIEEDDCCKWDGIVCNNLTGHVHELHLRGPNYQDYCSSSGDSGEFFSFTRCSDYLKTHEEKLNKKKLGGKINPSLLSLEKLEFLDLSLNDFGGTQIPSFFGSLRNLRYLNLSEAQFSLENPPQLGNLSSMQVLSLERIQSSDNKIPSAKSLRWLSGLRMLRRLYLSGEDLSGAFDWLQVINTLTSLKKLYLDGCNLPQVHPADHITFGNLTSLSVLDVSYNDLDTSTLLRRWIFGLQNLVSLDITSCGVYNLNPGNSVAISNLTSLKTLFISDNEFDNSSSTMKELSSLGDNLVSLNMHSCDLTSPLLADLQNMTALVNLDLSSNFLDEIIQNSFGNFCNLKHIDLSDNDFGGLGLSEVLKSLFRCGSLKLVSLKIKSSNMSGSLLDSVAHLSSLKVLNLENNLIFGMIPSSIGLILSSLESLILKSNTISGPIPFSIGQLSSLTLLDLSSNTLSGPIPHSIGSLLSLERLDISRNRLNGSIPRSIEQLWRLKRFDIAENMLRGIIKGGHLANLTRLESFRADYNSLTITSDWVPPSQLQLLGLNSLSLGPGFPLWLQWQINLSYLDIANTGISGSTPSWFWSQFSRLSYLNISFNQMQANFSRIPASLVVLDATANNLRGPLPELSHGSMITFLDLSNNMFSGSLERLLCPKVQTGEALSSLNLGNNSLSGVIPECWEKWHELLFLNLENNKLSGRIPSSLGSTDLIFLNMGKNKLSGRLPYSLTNLTNLMILQLAENDFNGTIPKWIGTRIQSLTILKLRSNKFVVDVSDELCLLTSIQILDLAHNNLSGQIPACFSSFSVMSGEVYPLANNIMLFDLPYGVHLRGSASLLLRGREDIYDSILGLVTLLDLSSNYFSGHIPVNLTRLVSLKSLNLSRNHFTGSIPQRVGDMKLMESLDLSMNQLSGDIPMSLSSLSFLNHLNVSYNNLIGRIPSSTQLQSLDNSSFIGNKLCGTPLTNSCEPSAEAGSVTEHVEESTSGTDWRLIISILSGFALGFWVVVAPLMVSISWRIVFFNIMDKARYKIYDVTRNVFCH